LPEQLNDSPEDVERKRRYRERRGLVAMVIKSIPEAVIQQDAPPIKLWDFLFEYKGKKIALDIRLAPRARVSTLDESIKNLVPHPVDCLIFAFASTPPQELVQQLEQRNRVVGGKIRYVAGEDESTLHNELLGVLESV